MGQRSFKLGDPGIPKNGLLAGSGGGFTWRYADYALHADGLIERLEYETDEGPIPPDYVVGGSAKVDPRDVIEFDAKLTALGFWSLELKPPTSNQLEYLIAVNEKKGLHYAVWAHGSSEVPVQIKAIYDDIVRFAARRV